MISPTRANVGAYLEQLASTGMVVAYSDVSDHFRLPKNMPWLQNPLYKVFGQLINEDINAHRPLRVSIVVQKKKDKKTIPSNSYFATIARIRNMQIPSTQAEKKIIHDTELKATMQFYGFHGDATR